MIQCAPIFTDHMVLQQGKNTAVFGTGSPGETVTVSIPERKLSASTVVQPSGMWQVQLPPATAGEACTLRVNDLVFQDVVFGEVWLAGGQSNMEFMLKNAKGGAEELKQCASSGVRYFQVPRNTFVDKKYSQDFKAAAWMLPTPETAGEWSAVAYLAAKELSEKLGVPVGIIGCNYGGSSVSCWMPESDLQAHAAGHAYLEDYRAAAAGKTDAEMIAEYDAYVEYQTAWTVRMERCYQEDGNMKWDEIIRRCGENQWPGPMGVKSPYRPAGMFHTMLKRIVPYTLRGVFYYQGENDDHRPETYSSLLTVMIARWRQEFQDDTLPFLLVQLPMFAYEDAPENGTWSKLREGQMQVFRTVKNTGIAVALDCGELGNIHPTEKHTVAHRLALQARKQVYGEQELAAFGPLYAGNTVSGDCMTIQFSQAEQGMVWHGEPAGFELGGADGIYYPAKAVIDGALVHLTCEKVPVPVRARYAWVNYGPVSLYGKNGIPAAPFRTEPPVLPLLTSQCPEPSV